ncbi:Armadillo-like helical [Artemisia annua]|uniref:Armadillo-like helical n=1 Tax=Artemisia annua TaxID=35608 RepID=A0A2U1PYS2_ARTAN|nr:Armadillo-like helical [Artemisia annua]
MNQEVNKELKPSIFMNQELIKFEDEGCLRSVSSRQQEKIPREEIVWLLACIENEVISIICKCYVDKLALSLFFELMSELISLFGLVVEELKSKKFFVQYVETVSSSVVAVDIIQSFVASRVSFECDDLIVEMIEPFMKSVSDITLLLLFRDHHLKNIYSPMVNIMALVLEESEEISVDMIKPLFASINNNSEGVVPVARKLGEEVLKKSVDKLRPQLERLVTSLGGSLDNYSKVLTSICEVDLDSEFDMGGDGSAQLMQAAAAANHAQAIIITLLEEYDNIFGGPVNSYFEGIVLCLQLSFFSELVVVQLKC